MKQFACTADLKSTILRTVRLPWMMRLVRSLVLLCGLCLPVVLSAEEPHEEARLAAIAVLEEQLQEALYPGSPAFAAARTLVKLDYWSVLDGAALQRLESARDEAPIDVAWTFAVRWHFDVERQRPYLEELTELAFADPTRDSERAMQALLEVRSSHLTPAAGGPAPERSEFPWWERTEKFLKTTDDPRNLWLAGILVQQEPPSVLRPQAVETLEEALSAEDEQRVTRAALVLTHLSDIPPPLWGALQVACQTREEMPSRLWLQAARLLHAPQHVEDAELLRGWRSELREWTHDAELGEVAWQGWLREAARFGQPNRVAEIFDLLRVQDSQQDHPPETRRLAAEAILRLERRELRFLSWLDWVVIGVYGLSMVAIGYYYARRTRSAEDYLLGGRRMSPSLVGLSMFASLLSTLTFLAQPGEVVRNGPMTLVQVAAYPFVFWIVGWFLVPTIMRLRITSGYEMLEQRLGLSTRLLGSAIFLLLRLLWMATIIYVTTSTVLVPMLGWTQEMTPVVCAVIGAVTIIYTSLGGLRAVVVTDAVQTLILFGGALLAIGIITLEMGGIGAWWPETWYSQWQEPVWFDPSVRTSFFGLFLAMFSWQVCTNGSDQMAIQRFAATKDVRAARHVLAVSLTTSAVVMAFLVALGLALLAFFQSRPEYIPDGRTLFTDSDKMLPAFIVRRLPAGISGLIIAGLLAAAMSSLSSGVNSSCSVITSDFVNRCRKQKLTDHEQIRIARWISVIVGGLVVALSLYVSVVPGNIFELCFKIVNLLVGPLFLLFFLAIFIKRANAIAAWLGALAGSVVAVLIGFWEPMFGTTPPVSFVWLTPASFLVGILVALPLCRSKPKELVDS